MRRFAQVDFFLLMLLAKQTAARDKHAVFVAVVVAEGVLVTRLVATLVGGGACIKVPPAYNAG